MSRVVSVAESRTISLTPEAAYDRTIVVPLETLFVHRHLALPPVVGVEDQVGVWGGAVGETRTIRTGDGGVLRETLTALDPPQGFAYRIDVAGGPMRLLVDHVDGAWDFAPADDGTTVTWSWGLHPRSALTAPMVALVGRMWHGYARHALVTLDALVTA